MSEIDLIATCAFGLEAIVKRELQALGYDARTIQPGRIMFRADALAIARANLRLRCAERVLICLGRFEAKDFGQLFDNTTALPWHQWIPADGAFPVDGKSIDSQLSSVPACQRMVKKAIVEQLKAAHGVETLDETGATYKIEVALLKDVVTLTLDTTGPGLHKRGYRPTTGQAPLRETLAAALVLLSFWKPDRPLIDPFCGTGTIPIEAAMIGRQIAPGLRREFAAETWPASDPHLWQQARDEARALVQPPLTERIIGTDINPRDLKLARGHAEAAGVADDIHFQERDFKELSSKREYGCVICNPPYGHRVGDPREVEELYKSFPHVLRRVPTWSHFILTAYPDFERLVGQRADRRRKLYNGRIECQYFQFHGPKRADKLKHEFEPDREAEPEFEVEPEYEVELQRDDASDRVDEPTGDVNAAPEIKPEGEVEVDPARAVKTVRTADALNAAPTIAKPPRVATPPKPVFGGLKAEAERQANEFRNRLTKRARHLRRWPSRGITCYRLYERDIPEVPLIVDRYEDRLHMSEFARPHDRTPAEHADWLDLMIKTAGEVMEVHPKNIFMKFRDRQRGDSQYERRGSDGHVLVVQEGGLKFQVNLSDYLDTGLFLDHRNTRGLFREAAAGKRVLNLFGYTGSFTVYAAAGGAAATTTVDSSNTYLEWAEENLRLNNLQGGMHRMVRNDAADYLRNLHADVMFDLAIVDPPTFSNSKDRVHDWDIQRDHVPLLTKLTKHMTPGGVIFFSTNFRRFKLAEAELPGLQIREISKQTVPDDFRNRRIHRCWRFTVT